MMVMSSLPYFSLPSWSGVQKVVPAKFASQPSARSSSVGWPTDSWMVSQRFVGIEHEIVLARNDRQARPAFRFA